MVSWKNRCLFVTALAAWAVEQMWRCQSQGMLKYKFHSNTPWPRGQTQPGWSFIQTEGTQIPRPGPTQFLNCHRNPLELQWVKLHVSLTGLLLLSPDPWKVQQEFCLLFTKSKGQQMHPQHFALIFSSWEANQLLASIGERCKAGAKSCGLKVKFLDESEAHTRRKTQKLRSSNRIMFYKICTPASVRMECVQQDSVREKHLSED